MHITADPRKATDSPPVSSSKVVPTLLDHDYSAGPGNPYQFPAETKQPFPAQTSTDVVTSQEDKANGRSSRA